IAFFRDRRDWALVQQAPEVRPARLLQGTVLINGDVAVRRGRTTPMIRVAVAADQRVDAERRQQAQAQALRRSAPCPTQASARGAASRVGLRQSVQRADYRPALG